MPERPTLDGIRQASSGAFSKAKLMVGLKNEDDIEEQSETSSFLDEAVDIICPDLSFQQVRERKFSCCSLYKLPN